METEERDFDFIKKSVKHILKDFKIDENFEFFYISKYNKNEINDIYLSSSNFSNDMLAYAYTFGYTKCEIKNKKSKGLKEQLINNYKIKNNSP